MNKNWRTTILTTILLAISFLTMLIAGSLYFIYQDYDNLKYGCIYALLPCLFSAILSFFRIEHLLTQNRKEAAYIPTVSIALSVILLFVLFSSSPIPTRMGDIITLALIVLWTIIGKSFVNDALVDINSWRKEKKV